MKKIYKKRGNKNYKERKLLKDLEPFLRKKIEEDPTFESKIVPATNYSELQKLHTRYVAEDVEATFIDEPKEEIKEEEMAEKEERKEATEVEETVGTSEGKSSSNQFIDPFNREEPIVRDYVMDGGFQDESKKTNQPQKTFFEEPTSFDEAFVIPEAEDEENNANNSTSSSEKRKESGGSTEAMNPNFDDMSAGKKKRSTKKFAKYIVEAVSTLSQKGFVWYANQDINEAKLTEYEMSGEMDLSLLVSLEDGQEVTVKQFFQVQCEKAEQMSHWTDEQKADMSAALAEVLMEKGVAPTPTQELILVTLTIIGGQAMTLFTLKSQTNSLLNQLRSMNEGGGEMSSTYEEPPIETPPPVTETEMTTETKSVEKEETIEDFTKLQEESNEDFGNELASLTEEEVLISNDNIETKE